MKNNYAITIILAFISFTAYSQSTTPYTQQIENYDASFNVGTAGAFNNGSTEIGFYANGAGTKQIVLWKNFTDDGTTAGTSNTMNVGDSFKISLAAFRAYGQIGISLLSNPSSTLSWDDRINNYALQVNLNGNGGAFDPWEIVSTGGTTSQSNIFGSNSGSINEFVFTFTLKSPTSMEVVIEKTNNTVASYSVTVTLNNTNITGYSIYLDDDWDGDSNENIYWKPNTEYTYANTWNGNNGTNWATNSNWSTGNVPSSTSNVNIPSTTNLPVIGSTTDAQVEDIYIETGASLTISEGGSLTVNNDFFNNSGIINLNSTSTSYSSLIVGGAATGTVTYNRYTAQVGPTGTNDLVAAPLSGDTFGAFASANPNLATSGSTAAFAPFNTGTGVYENYDTSANSATPLSAGTGYRAATTGGSPLAFTGTVETGTVTVGITDGSSSFWNLVGNPYPSYLDLGDFLTANAATTVINGTYYGVYGYDGNASNGWTVWDLNANQDNLIAPGQGFFVAAPSGGGTNITFTPAMRRSGSADDFITGRVADANFAQAILNMNTAASTYTTNLYFRDTNTQGLDAGYDTGAFDGTANGIYTQLVQDNTGVNLYNQSLPYSDLGNITVPVAVNADSGVQLMFALNGASVLPTDILVYLEDTASNTWTLLNTTDYILTPTVSLSGTGRFYLHFTNTTLSNADQTLNGLQVYAQRQTLVIHGQLPRATTLTLYDLQGRPVLQQTLDAEQTQRHIPVAGLASGVYVVQLQNSTQVRTQKVVLH